MEPYSHAAHDDIELALQLYTWNVRLGQALRGDIAHFEVALRNAYDRALRKSWKGSDHWLLDEQSPVRRTIMRTSKRKKPRDVNLVNRRAIAEACGRAHDPENPDQVIAGLMLGFWTHMTDRSRERDLWIPHLHTAWPKGTDRAKLHRSLFAINKVRNRVAHNERLFNPGDAAFSPAKVDDDVLRLLGDLCPEAAEHLYGNDRRTSVELFCKEHPMPVRVEL